MDEEDMLGELRAGRTRTLLVLAGAALVLVLLFVYFAFLR
jgi:hypothetical protein